MKILFHSFLVVLTSWIASATDVQLTETVIAKGYGKVSLALPGDWTVVRFDQGWESTDSTFYRVFKGSREKRDENDEQWTPGFLLCFEREVRNPDLEIREFRPLVGEPKYGTIDSGLDYCRVERLGPQSGNGPAIINQRNVTYHFSGLPYNFEITISGPKDLLVGDSLSHVEKILTTIVVEPTAH